MANMRVDSNPSTWLPKPSTFACVCGATTTTECVRERAAVRDAWLSLGEGTGSSHHCNCQLCVTSSIHGF